MVWWWVVAALAMGEPEMLVGWLQVVVVLQEVQLLEIVPVVRVLETAPVVQLLETLLEVQVLEMGIGRVMRQPEMGIWPVALRVVVVSQEVQQLVVAAVWVE